MDKGMKWKNEIKMYLMPTARYPKREKGPRSKSCSGDSRQAQFWTC